MKPVKYALLLLSTLILTPDLYADQAEEPSVEKKALPHRYDQIVAEYLSSFPLAAKKDHRDEEGKNGFSLDYPELSQREIAEFAIDRLKADEKYLKVPTASVITSNDVWSGVRLYASDSQQPEDTVVGGFKPKTATGRLVLTKMLTDLTRDTQVLTKRQDFLRQLTTDDYLYEKCYKLLKSLKKQESNLLAMMRDNDPIKDTQLSKLLGHQKGMAALSAFNKAVNDFLIPLFTIAGPFISYFYYQHTTRLFIDSGALNALADNSVWRRRLLTAGAYFTPVMYGVIPLIMPWALIKYRKTYMYAKKRIRALHYFNKTIRRIYDLDLPVIGSDASEIIDRRSSKVEHFASAVSDKIFNNNRFFFEGGGSLFRSLDDIQQGLIPRLMRGLHVVGTLDAFVTMARTMRKHKETAVHFCFAEFKKADRAQIEALDFWHPSLPHEKAVSNSLQLGMPNTARNLVITGVNEGGKSTSMRALALCILLGQTFGIAPASRFAFTPFKQICMSMDVTDDIGADQSLFKVELENNYKMLETAHNLKDGDHMIAFLDEILRGTERVEGEAAAYGIGRRLAEYPQCMVLLATHYPGLTHLENDTSGIYKNMHVRVDIDENGLFHYPYRLFNGQTSQQIAIDILEREKFNQNIIDTARDVLASPDKYLPTDADV